MRLQRGLQVFALCLVLCLTGCVEGRFGWQPLAAKPMPWCRRRCSDSLHWNRIFSHESLHFYLTRVVRRPRESNVVPRWRDVQSSENDIDQQGVQFRWHGNGDATLCSFATLSPPDRRHEFIRCFTIASFRGGGGRGDEANCTAGTHDHKRMNSNSTPRSDNSHSSDPSKSFLDSTSEHGEKDLEPRDKTTTDKYQDSKTDVSAKSTTKPLYTSNDVSAKSTTKPLYTSNDAPAAKRRRRLANLITDLCTRSGGDGKPLSVESIELRRLIAQRRDECLRPILNANADDNGKLSHPKQLLHYLAPKIPAIRHSPDVGHRIRSARSDMDSGVAACLIGTLGYVAARYSGQGELGPNTDDATARKIVQDRRFEQLIECVLCGVDVRKRRTEWALMQQHSDDKDAISAGVIISKDMEIVVDEADFVEGLSIRDSCRAAWGIAVLRVHDVTSKLGGANVTDLFIALLLRIRELLLARLKRLRRSEFLDEHGVSSGAHMDAVSSIDERLLDYSDELAEDAAMALWTMAAVRVCTGIHCQPLVDVCCLILCTNPWDVRRQAQEVEATVNSATIMVGSNDIVERLALSEAEQQSIILNNASVEPTSNMTTLRIKEVDAAVSVLERKTMLLEWLSPIQLVDAVWSLSVVIQGSENQTKLSEADAAFQDIAFDRILSWLTDGLPTTEYTERDRSGDSVMFVDEELTVNAGSDTLLSVSRMPFMRHPIIAVANVDNAGSEFNDQSEAAPSLITTVDADLVELIDTEGIATLVPDHYIDAYTDTGESTSVPSIDMLDCETYGKYFSLQDLCAIAWAVTEVHDSLRGSITSSIVKTIVYGNPRTIATLSGGDIANLAWAIAKNIDTRVGADVTFAARTVELLVNDIVHERLGSPEIPDLLTHFHPAELSRLLWSVATFQSCFGGTLSWNNLDTVELSVAALTTAATNTQNFCTEDLGRLAWSFLSLSDPKLRFDENGVQQALTKVLSTVEADLIGWETGKAVPSEDIYKNANPKRATVATEFSRFFRRSLIHVPFLDTRLDVFNDESSEGDVAVNAEKPRRPSLKDLPVDILTISKIACACSRLELESGVFVSDTFTRIAVRLMVSQNSRLMRDCPIQDLARLCEAVARTKTPGLTEVISLFSRRFVQHVNGPGKAEVVSLGTCESIRLMWSLGELGVKYASDDDDATTAHRRLRLATKLHLLVPTINSMDRVPDQELLQLLRSLTSMRIVDVDKTLVLLSLSSLEKRVMQLDNKMQLSEALLSTELLRSAVEPAFTDISVSHERNSFAPDLDYHKGVASDDNKKILDLCIQINRSILARAVSVATKLQPQSIRSILMVVFNQRIPNVTAINAFDVEINARMTAGEHRDVNGRWENATAALDLLPHILVGMNKSESSAAVPWISNMRSLFGFSSSETSSEKANSIHQQLHVAAESALNAATIAISPYIKAAELRDLFELGVCIRLIDQFRRDCSACDQLEGFNLPETFLGNSQKLSSRFYP